MAAPPPAQPFLATTVKGKADELRRGHRAFRRGISALSDSIEAGGSSAMPTMAQACTRPIALAALLATSLLLAAPASLAADTTKTGRQKALQCQTCHGLDGLSKLPEAPNLGGQIEQYLVKALNDYKSGARKNDMMSVAEPLSDEDIVDLARYYASIEFTVKKP
jgi:cytochrome c553